jgi:hypothetical protein
MGEAFKVVEDYCLRSHVVWNSKPKYSKQCWNVRHQESKLHLHNFCPRLAPYCTLSFIQSHLRHGYTVVATNRTRTSSRNSWAKISHCWILATTTLQRHHMHVTKTYAHASGQWFLQGTLYFGRWRSFHPTREHECLLILQVCRVLEYKEVALFNLAGLKKSRWLIIVG